MGKAFFEKTTSKVDGQKDGDTWWQQNLLCIHNRLKESDCIKYINLIYHHMPVLIEEGEQKIKLIFSSSIFPNGLIKALAVGLFKKH